MIPSRFVRNMILLSTLFILNTAQTDKATFHPGFLDFKPVDLSKEDM